MARIEISEGTDLTNFRKSDILTWLKNHDEDTTQYWGDVQRYFSALNLKRAFVIAIVGQDWTEVTEG